MRGPIRRLGALLAAPAQLEEARAMWNAERIARSADQIARVRLVTELAWDGGNGTMMAAVTEVLERLRAERNRVTALEHTAEKWRSRVHQNAWSAAAAEIQRLTERLADAATARSALEAEVLRLQADDAHRPPVDERRTAAGEGELGDLTAGDHLVEERPRSPWFARETPTGLGGERQTDAVDDQSEHTQNVAHTCDDGEEPAR